MAVFLALGVGVAMGASFVDRATVDSLRGRVDDLAENYRRRGDELDATKAQLNESDGQAGALAGEASEALVDRLTGQPVVIIAADGVPGDVLDATRTSLAAANATPSGLIRLLPAIELRDEGVLRRVRDEFGLRTGGVKEVRSRVLEDLGAALTVLAGGTASPPDGAPATTETTTTTETDETSPGVTAPSDDAGARTLISTMVDLGLISLDTSNAPDNGAFPDVGGVRYVLVASSVDGGSDAVVLALAGSVARQAPAVLTVAETRPSRPDGEATTTTEDQPDAASCCRTSARATWRTGSAPSTTWRSPSVASHSSTRSRSSTTRGRWGTTARGSEPPRRSRPSRRDDR